MTTSGSATWINRIGRRLKLRDLHIFLAVAESRNMSKAAGHLAVSRPVVSQAMADLEHTLGVELVERSSEGVELTMYGRALLRWSVAVFDDLRQGVKEIEFLADPSVGEIRIGCPEVIAAGILPVIVERLTRKYPRAVVQVSHLPQSDTIPVLLRQLRERSIDILFGRIPAQLDEDDLIKDVLFEDRMFVVSGLRSHWARKRKVELADLVDESWILPPQDTVITSYLADAFRAKALTPPSAKVITFSAPLRTALLETGRYLSVLSESSLRFGPKHSRLVKLPIDLPTPPGPIALVRLKSRGQPPLVPEFIECARAVVKMGLARPQVRKR